MPKIRSCKYFDKSQVWLNTQLQLKKCRSWPIANSFSNYTRMPRMHYMNTDSKTVYIDRSLILFQIERTRHECIIWTLIKKKHILTDHWFFSNWTHPPPMHFPTKDFNFLRFVLSTRHLHDAYRSTCKAFIINANPLAKPK